MRIHRGHTASRLLGGIRPGVFFLGGATTSGAGGGFHLFLGVLVHGARVGAEVFHGGGRVVVVVVVGDGGVVVEVGGVDVDVLCI